MARKRNKMAKSDDKVEAGSEVLTSDADLAAIEALLDGDAEVALDSPEPDAEPVEAEAATDESAGDDQALMDEALAAIEAEPAPAVVSDEDVTDDVAEAIAGEEAKGEAYADQTSDIDIKEDAVEAAPETKVETKVETKAPKKPASPKLGFEETIRLMHANDPITLDSEEGPLNDDGIATLIADVYQVKVREKVTNLLNGVLNDAGISKYTVIALEVLKKAYHEDTVVTAADIKKAYEAHGYKSGTVNAQQGQMMVLFSALGMAKRIDRGTLKPNPNSVLLDALCA